MSNAAFRPAQEFTINSVASGLYSISADLLSDTLMNMKTSGSQVFLLEGVTDRSSYLKTAAKTFEFGSYFGHNWDALSDCLGDLEWKKGDRIVVLHAGCKTFATAHPADWNIMMEVWESTVEFWNKEGVALSIVFQD